MLFGHFSWWPSETWMLINICTPYGALSLFILKLTMSKHGFPFLENEKSVKFILSRFFFRRFLQELGLPPLRPLPPNLLLLCPRFVKARVECYANDIGVPNILRFVFYCSILQEAIRFNIIPPLMAHNLTKNVEEFNRQSFELWLFYQRELNCMSGQRIVWWSSPWGWENWEL